MTAQHQADREAAQLDSEGYLVDPTSWNEAVAAQLAQKEGITLTAQHWQIIRYMRNHYDDHRTAPDVRHVMKFLTEDLGHGRKASARLFELFPYGYPQQACKIAGMKRPRAWSTG